MSSNRDYNKTRFFGRFVLQIIQTQQGGYKGYVIHLTPQITVSFSNPRALFAVGFEWLTSTVNFGYVRQSYVDGEKNRQLTLQKQADDLGITKHQEELRWGW